MNNKDNRIHLNYIDGLRALAAVYVVIHHALTQVSPNGNVLSGREKLFASAFTFGHEAVDLFIVISGFCLMLPVVRNDGELVNGVYEFYVKRSRRILPPYYIALFITLLAIGTLIGDKTGSGWDSALPVTFKSVLAHLLLIQDVFHDTSDRINGAFWSISVEFRIYLLFPLIIVIWNKLGPIITTIVSLFFSLVVLFFLSYSPVNYDLRTMVGIMPQYIFLFTLGALGASVSYSDEIFMVRLKEKIPWMLLTFISLLVSVFFCRANLFDGKRLPTAFSDLFVGIWAMAMLVTVTIDKDNMIRRFLSWRPISFIGTFAYSIYLIHGPLQQIIWKFILNPSGAPPFTIFVIQSTLGTSLIIGLSYCFFLVGERPFMRKNVLKQTASG